MKLTPIQKYKKLSKYIKKYAHWAVEEHYCYLERNSDGVMSKRWKLSLKKMNEYENKAKKMIKPKFREKFHLSDFMLNDHLACERLASDLIAEYVK